MSRRKQSFEERIWSRVEKTDGCWNWQGVLTRGGYGRITPPGRQGTYYVHRIVYTLLRGPIPEGRQLDHLCRNPRCCNPDHLEIVTPTENLNRSLHPRNWSQHGDRCKRGHEMTPDNIGLNGSARYCRQCKRAWVAQWRLKHLEASRERGRAYYHRTKGQNID